MNMKFIWAAALAAAFSLGLAACEKEGTVERVGEEVDEAVDTMKHGEESTATKIDDTVDEMREGAREAREEAKE
jgi:hypothetical protein